MSRSTLSSDSIANATRSRASFSGHGNAKGAAGLRAENDGAPGDFLSGVGDMAIVNPHVGGFEKIHIGFAWDSIVEKKEGFWNKLFSREETLSVDLDLGCLYELQDGERGAIQAFGDLFGDYSKSPYIHLSGDERTGESEGDDEYMSVNGQKWPDIKRILFYTYIYDGAPNWAALKPQIQILVPNERPMVVVPNVNHSELGLCVIGGMENVRNGIKITNYTEYFPGHAEMDRAFGFGLEWADGVKI